MTLQKLAKCFRLGALICAIGLVPSSNVAAADQPAAPAAQTKAAAQALPAPGTYEIDPDHSFAYFGASHHVVGLVRGRFDKVAGTITVSQDPAACSVDVTIDPSSISTQVGERDEDLRGPAYFAVKTFPTISYRGRGIRRVSASTWTMDGSLTNSRRDQSCAADVHVQRDVLRCCAWQTSARGVPWVGGHEARRFRHGGARQRRSRCVRGAGRRDRDRRGGGRKGPSSSRRGAPVKRRGAARGHRTPVAEAPLPPPRQIAVAAPVSVPAASGGCRAWPAPVRRCPTYADARNSTGWRTRR
jgi:polyisoprenoid-binding protein YceI